MNQYATPSNRWYKFLHTPVSQLLRGHITGPQSPLDRVDTSKLSESVVEAIRTITLQFKGYRQLKITRQLVKHCQMLLREGRAERQLVSRLSAPDSIASLIQITGRTDWILNSQLPASLVPT
ncbi:MAG: hypothetical protein QM501_02475, partial [Gimesia sp.]